MGLTAIWTLSAAMGLTAIWISSAKSLHCLPATPQDTRPSYRP